MPPRMLTYAIILALGFAGYANAPAWLVMPGAAGLTLDGWRLWRFARPERVTWTSKTTTYFVTGVIADLVLAALAFGAGRIVRLLVG